MTAFQAGADYGDGRREEAHGRAAAILDYTDPASRRIIVGYGFWIFLLSDIIMFSAFFATFFGFAMIWQIWWLAVVALLGAYATFVVFAWRDRTEYEIPAEDVARIDRANRRARGEALATVEAIS